MSLCVILLLKHFFSEDRAVVWAVFSVRIQFIAGRNFPESNMKEKSLSLSFAHSLDSLRADSYLREAGPQGCVLASWQVPSVKQRLCVCV